MTITNSDIAEFARLARLVEHYGQEDSKHKLYLSVRRHKDLKCEAMVLDLIKLRRVFENFYQDIKAG